MLLQLEQLEGLQVAALQARPGVGSGFHKVASGPAAVGAGFQSLKENPIGGRALIPAEGKSRNLVPKPRALEEEGKRCASVGLCVTGVCVCWVVFKPAGGEDLKLGVGRTNETFSVLRGTDPPCRLQRLITGSLRLVSQPRVLVGDCRR